MNSNGRRLRSTLIAAAAATTLTLTVAPALSPAAATQGPAKTPSAVTTTSLVYDKNPGSPTNSKLKVYQGTKLLASYRAGSGLGSKNDCAVGEGWIPNGNWKIKLKDPKYNGQYIKGYAVYLEDMGCSKNPHKKIRTQMFIHSEMNRDGSQGRSEQRSWQDSKDYRSAGCVKLHPDHITHMFKLLNRIGWPTHLRVVS
ncbi:MULTISPECIES: L,D-transpeptidase family protein [unclassified Streptomyces]|uniref:L,D-transpeptidase family protein n=1 Tax=unclassified Streptomyces TaxID=2593676 RepID=UPI00036EBD2A|nr:MULTISPECIES: L,D-transpeptidase family protein [unclassified Streptomyces]MYX32681.1 L,D-transpeptidase family protein [Streptomyces sp. SID8377]